MRREPSRVWKHTWGKLGKNPYRSASESQLEGAAWARQEEKKRMSGWQEEKKRMSG